MVRAMSVIGVIALFATEARADQSCGLENPRIARTAPAVPVKPGEVAGLGESGLPVVRRMRRATVSAYGVVGHGATGGALSGRTIYVSPGHGWTWRDNGLGWRTQRGNTHDLVEDFISVETIGQFLVPMLRNMGAYVVPVRETDTRSEIAIVDDVEVVVEGDVALSEGPVGFGLVPLPITDQTNPFASGGSRELASAATETGRVIWSFDVPRDGAYNVYVGWVQDPSRASDAHYIVRHAGGEAHFRVDQRRHGGTWVLLGRFYFRAGRSPERAAVVLANDSADTGSTLSADVARIGGGLAMIDRGGGVLARPMFESCARYYAQLAGAPASVYDYSSDDGSDDVGTRSRFAAWEHEAGEDAVYIAWHTNAPSPARGTSTFVYGPSSYGPVSEFTGVPGSVELATAVHGELVADIRAVWEAGWTDRGLHSAYFGEVNPNHNPEMPAALFEVAFHSTAEDAEALRDPRFRYLAARAIAQGIARYFSERDGAALTLPPEPPLAPQLRSDGSGGLILSWRAATQDAAAGDPATGYRVYLSRDGLAFDDGVEVATESLAIAAPEDGGAVYARVTATNAGGESFPSRVVGARATARSAQVLIVGGFDRIDGAMLIREDLSAFALATIERALIARINDESHLARYGAAVDAARVSFDSASAAAIATGDASLEGYAAVIWQLGEEREPLGSAERDAIAAYLAGGGKLMISGTDVGAALDGLGGPDEQAFYRQILGAAYVADDAGTYAFGRGSGAFAGMPEMSFDDFGDHSYDADLPDVIAPGPGSETVLSYAGGAGGAAVWRADLAGAKVLVLGFPFETIAGAAERADFMARVLAGFGVKSDPELPSADPDDSDLTAGCGCNADGGGAPALALVLLALAWAARRSGSTRRSA